MFASRKINTDPLPWRCNEHDDSCRDPQRSIACHTFSPRPEYGNEPNPVLVAFRELDRVRACSTTGHNAAQELQHMAWDAERDAFTYWNDLPEIPTYAQMTLARKVLERLARTAGSEVAR